MERAYNSPHFLIDFPEFGVVTPENFWPREQDVPAQVLEFTRGDLSLVDREIRGLVSIICQYYRESGCLGLVFEGELIAVIRADLGNTWIYTLAEIHRTDIRGVRFLMDQLLKNMVGLRSELSVRQLGENPEAILWAHRMGHSLDVTHGLRLLALVSPAVGRELHPDVRRQHRLRELLVDNRLDGWFEQEEIAPVLTPEAVGLVRRHLDDDRPVLVSRAGVPVAAVLVATATEDQCVCDGRGVVYRDLDEDPDFPLQELGRIWAAERAADKAEQAADDPKRAADQSS